MTYLNDTIAAIATGMNQGGIGIIRVSGNNAIQAVDSIFVPKNQNRRIINLDSYTAAYGNIVKKNENSIDIIDEVIVLIMKAPSTYTTEDVVEIDCHGGVQVMKKILHLLIQNGVRIAEPGEFTKRAFLNGRIDLSQAESVMDLISAKSDFAAKSALLQLKGDLKEKIKSLRENLIYYIAYIESALDDPEHYSLDGFDEKLMEILNQTQEEIQHLIRSSDDGKIMKEGIRTVILGKPNAGKSSILNVIMGKERAIVTDIAGTTRDTLEEFVSIQGIPLNIIDTAGIRNTEDVVEQIGVNKSLQEIKNADLILYVIDGSVTLDENDRQIMESILDKNVIILQNKSDLDNVINENDIIGLWNEIANQHNNSNDLETNQIIDISAKENTGFQVFYDLLNHMFFHDNLSYNDEIYITNLRHKEALEQSLKSIFMVKQSIEDGMPEDFYSIDLMDAYEKLGFIIGEAVEDDLVNTIFKEFCMGK